MRANVILPTGLHQVLAHEARAGVSVVVLTDGDIYHEDLYHLADLIQRKAAHLERIEEEANRPPRKRVVTPTKVWPSDAEYPSSEREGGQKRRTGGGVGVGSRKAPARRQKEKSRWAPAEGKCMLCGQQRNENGCVKCDA